MSAFDKADMADQAVAGSVDDAIKNLRSFWEDFVAKDSVEIALNQFTYTAFQAEEQEFLGINAPTFGTLNPYGLFYKAFAGSLSHIGVRKEYFGLMDCLEKACPRFDDVDWTHATTRVLIGASEVVQGFETVFDFRRRQENATPRHGKAEKIELLASAIAAHLVRGRGVRNVALLSKAQQCPLLTQRNSTLFNRSNPALSPCGQIATNDEIDGSLHRPYVSRYPASRSPATIGSTTNSFLASKAISVGPMRTALASLRHHQ